MLIYEYKLAGNKRQFAAIDEAIWVVQFIRNKCLRLWMDERGISKNDLQCYCADLAREYSFAHNLNSQARQRLGRAHLKVQRQREDFARREANTLVTSNDLIAYEHLQIRNMVKNHHLAKSIHDAGWGQFLRWVKYYGTLHEMAVAPQYTSQNCWECGTLVKKSLSMRTHICTGCGVVLDREHNAALNILAKALECTVGHTGTDEQDSSNASGQTASTSRLRRATGKRAG